MMGPGESYPVAAPVSGSVGGPQLANVAGIVLCGGKSSRMGSPKAWLPWGGRTFLEVAVAAVAEGLGDPDAPVIVVAAPSQRLPPLPSTAWVVADPGGDLGPLQGLVTGLATLPPGCEAAFVAACDGPLLRPAVVARMLQFLLEDAALDAVVPGESDGTYCDDIHPLAAAYRPRLLPTAARNLAHRHLSLRSLLLGAAARFVPVAEFADIDPGLASFANVNTPEEYAELLARGGPP